MNNSVFGKTMKETRYKTLVMKLNFIDIPWRVMIYFLKYYQTSLILRKCITQQFKKIIIWSNTYQTDLLQMRCLKKCWDKEWLESYKQRKVWKTKIKEELLPIAWHPDCVIDRPHFAVKFPNQQHQFDVLYMHKTSSKAACASRSWLVLTWLRGTKWLNLWEQRRHVMWLSCWRTSTGLNVTLWNDQRFFQLDNSSEFKADVTKLLESHKVKINHVTTKYKHTHSCCQVI